MGGVGDGGRLEGPGTYENLWKLMVCRFLRDFMVDDYYIFMIIIIFIANLGLVLIQMALRALVFEMLLLRIG